MRLFECGAIVRHANKGLFTMATRQTHVRKFFGYADNTTSRSAKVGWTSIMFELVAPFKDAKGDFIPLETVTIPRSSFPAEIVDCAAGHGFGQKIGDDLAGIAIKAAKEVPAVHASKERGFAEYIKSRIADMVENLSNGFWVEESEAGGSNLTILLAAVIRTFEAAGKVLSDAQIEHIKGALKGSEYSAGLKARADISKHYADITSERAAERAKKAQENLAGSVDMPDLDTLLLVPEETDDDGDGDGDDGDGGAAE